jgi:hypothetical protein
MLAEWAAVLWSSGPQVRGWTLGMFGTSFGDINWRFEASIGDWELDFSLSLYGGTAAEQTVYLKPLEIASRVPP